MPSCNMFHTMLVVNYSEDLAVACALRRIVFDALAVSSELVSLPSTTLFR